jgi:hypothetical protein
MTSTLAQPFLVNRPHMRAFLHRVAAASPLVPALGDTAVAWLVNLVAPLAPQAWAVLLPALLLWVAAGVLFFVVVIWFRDDDWLAAGFLLAVTFLLSAWTGDLLAAVVTQGSLAPALLAAPGILLGVTLRAVIGVPLLGGLVALLRWLTRRRRPAAGSPRTTSGAPPA